jgi:aminopeptidase C
MGRLLRTLSVPAVVCGVLCGAAVSVGLAVVGREPESPAAVAPNETPDDETRLFSVKWCTREKQRIANELAAGRCTLLAAADVTRTANRLSPEFNWKVFRLDRPGQTDAERHCREVISWVRHVPLEGSAMDTLVRTLEDEITRRKADGTLVLPADDGPPQPASR